jgi:signal transduction histidine kinase
MPPTSSLSLRVALIAAGGSAIALLVAGAVFIYQFSNAVQRNFDARLETLLLTLITATDVDGGVDESAVEGRSGGSFSRPLSGWYWQVRDAETGRGTDWSESLRFDILPVQDLPNEADPVRTFNMEASGGRELRALEQLVTLGEGRTYALLVAGDTRPMVEDIRGFRNSVMRWLGGLALLLAIGLAGLVRWGLRPLRRVSEDLGRIREGEIRHLEGHYPAEIEPLVQDLNALIDSNREIVERARTHVGNLAHALKTPLAVLQNEARAVDGPLGSQAYRADRHHARSGGAPSQSRPHGGAGERHRSGDARRPGHFRARARDAQGPPGAPAGDRHECRARAAVPRREARL